MKEQHHRGKALIEFWSAVSGAVVLDEEHAAGNFTGTRENHQHRRDSAMQKAGDALYAFTVSIVPTTAAKLLAGEPAPV